MRLTKLLFLLTASGLPMLVGCAPASLPALSEDSAREAENTASTGGGAMPMGLLPPLLGVVDCYSNLPGSFYVGQDPYEDPGATPALGCDNSVTECTVDVLDILLLGADGLFFLPDDDTFIYRTFPLTEDFLSPLLNLGGNEEVYWNSDEHWAFVVDGTYECDDEDATILTLSTEQGELNLLHGIAEPPLVMTGYVHASPEGETDVHETSITEDGEIFRHAFWDGGQQQFFRTCVRIL